MRGFQGTLLLALFVLAPAALFAQSERDPADKLREVRDLLRELDRLREREPATGALFADTGLRLGVYHVADLTALLEQYGHPNFRLRAAGTEFDEDAPPFGKVEPGEAVFVGIEDLLDLLQENVVPEAWSREGCSLQVSGQNSFLVRAPPEVHAAVREFLAELRASLGRLVTTEVRILGFSPQEAARRFSGRGAVTLGAKEAEELLAGAGREGPVRILASARLTSMNGQQAMFYRAAEHAYVQDYDVEVAQTAKISDPVVDVLQEGFTFHVRTTARGEDLCIVDLSLHVGRLQEPFRVVETPSGPVMAPSYAFAAVDTTVTVGRGKHVLLAGCGGTSPWGVLISARSAPYAPAAKGGGR